MSSRKTSFCMETAGGFRLRNAARLRCRLVRAQWLGRDWTFEWVPVRLKDCNKAREIGRKRLFGTWPSEAQVPLACFPLPPSQIALWLLHSLNQNTFQDWTEKPSLPWSEWQNSHSFQSKVAWGFCFSILSWFPLPPPCSENQCCYPAPEILE